MWSGSSRQVMVTSNGFSGETRPPSSGMVRISPWKTPMVVYQKRPIGPYPGTMPISIDIDAISQRAADRAKRRLR